MNRRQPTSTKLNPVSDSDFIEKPVFNRDETITTAYVEPAVAAKHKEEKPAGKKFGTFNGVIRPTILTILGVMMYLREGWLVGNAGLFGAIIIILMGYVITGTTALSLSYYYKYSFRCWRCFYAGNPKSGA